MSYKQGREVLLVGSVPFRPASRVFEAVSERLGSFVRRIPDGEQRGWMRPIFEAHNHNPALEIREQVPITRQGPVMLDLIGLKPGATVRDLRLGPYGFAEAAVTSYVQFKAVRDQGRIPPGVRFQLTLPGPGTTVVNIKMSPEDILPLAREALAREIEEVLQHIPAADLTIQFDLTETNVEEYRRSPERFTPPTHLVTWTLDQTAESVGWLASQVPSEVELGIHFCSRWHHDPGAGQDNAVMVDVINTITQRVTRRLAYVHMPLIPEHDQTAMEPLRNLRLRPETKLFLGVIHVEEPPETSKRLAATAAKVVPDFGVAAFCGLGQVPETEGARAYEPGLVSRQRASAARLESGAILDLHRAVAELAA